MVTDSDAHVLFAGIQSWLTAAVTGQDIILLEHVDDYLAGCIGRQYLAKEIVCLRGHHAEEGNGTQLLLEVIPFLDELGTGTLVVLFVFIVYLHEELGKRVQVPYAHLFLDTGNQLLIGGGEDAQT